MDEKKEDTISLTVGLMIASFILAILTCGVFAIIHWWYGLCKVSEGETLLLTTLIAFFTCYFIFFRILAKSEYN